MICRAALPFPVRKAARTLESLDIFAFD